MSGVAVQAAPNRLQAAIDADLAPIAVQIDQEGLYPADAMRAIGAAGAFNRHLRQGGNDLGAAVDAMAAISATCMSAGFCTWCQDAAGWYLEQSDNAALRGSLQPGLGSGAAMGGTGLSNPMKSLSGIERFKLRAARVPGGYEVSGVLPWVSNLGPGHLFGTVFEDAADPQHRIMAMLEVGQQGVEIRHNARFIALEGTGTYSVLFRRARIDDAQLLADPLGDMVKRIKPGFILLQTGMGLGVIQACIDLMREADVTHGHSNAYLLRRAADFAADLAALSHDIAALSKTPTDPSPAYLRGVLQARLRTSELTLEAGQAALMHAGSRGYIEHSPVNRRIREGYFVAIITPSIRHLRQELAKTDLKAVH